MRLRWTPRALTALTDIHAYVAADNQTAANELRDRVLSFAEVTLLSHPSIGRPGRVDGTRESVILPSYILVYRVRGQVIEVLTIRHVAKQWPNRF